MYCWTDPELFWGCALDVRESPKVSKKVEFGEGVAGRAKTAVLENGSPEGVQGQLQLTSYNIFLAADVL